MRNCGCSGQTCGCLVTGGTGIEVTGSGTISNPFVVNNTASDLASSFAVNDTTTLNLTLGGSGTNLDPFILSGVVTLTLEQLTDVSNPGGVPLVGEAPIYVGVSGAGGHWEFARVFKSYTTAGRPSAATAGAGAVYYDTTLSKPGWSTGSLWKDAAGTTI